MSHIMLFGYCLVFFNSEETVPSYFYKLHAVTYQHVRIQWNRRPLVLVAIVCGCAVTWRLSYEVTLLRKPLGW